jgi:hypothetical protein
MKLNHLIETEANDLLDYSDFVSTLDAKHQDALLDVGKQLIKLGYTFHTDGSEDEGPAFIDGNEEYLVIVSIIGGGGYLKLDCDTGGQLGLGYTVTTQGMKGRPMKEVLTKIQDATNALEAVKHVLPGGTTKREIVEA